MGSLHRMAIVYLQLEPCPFLSIDFSSYPCISVVVSHVCPNRATIVGRGRRLRDVRRPCESRPNSVSTTAGRLPWMRVARCMALSSLVRHGARQTCHRGGDIPSLRL
jgi:hypothetical protein